MTTRGHCELLRAAFAACCVSLLLCSACTRSPTLPLPPPTAISSAPDSLGVVLVTGNGAVEGAWVSVFNEQLQEGRIGVADDLGSFAVEVPASVGDTLLVWQHVGAEQSAFVTIIVPRE